MIAIWWTTNIELNFVYMLFALNTSFDEPLSFWKTLCVLQLLQIMAGIWHMSCTQEVVLSSEADYQMIAIWWTTNIKLYFLYMLFALNTSFDEPLYFWNSVFFSYCKSWLVGGSHMQCTRGSVDCKCRALEKITKSVGRQI